MSDQNNVPDHVRFEVVMASGKPPSSGVMFMEWRSDREHLCEEPSNGELVFTFAVSLSMLQQTGYLHDNVCRCERA